MVSQFESQISAHSAWKVFVEVEAAFSTSPGALTTLKEQGPLLSSFPKDSQADASNLPQFRRIPRSKQLM